MDIHVKVYPNARRNEVKKEGEVYKVYLNVPPVEGKANQRLIDVLADFFEVRKSAVIITKGLKSRLKTIRILLS